MIRSIPTINTSRLALRSFRSEDFDRFAEILAMPEVERNAGGGARTRREAWDCFLRNAGHWQMTGFGQWAVVDQRSREMLGQVGFAYGSDPKGEDFDDFPEILWALVPDAQGKGYVVEAVRAAHDWFDRVIPGRLVAQVSVGNRSALRLSEQLGYRELRRIGGDGEGAVALMRRDGPPGGR